MFANTLQRVVMLKHTEMEYKICKTDVQLKCKMDIST